MSSVFSAGRRPPGLRKPIDAHYREHDRGDHDAAEDRHGQPPHGQVGRFGLTGQQRGDDAARDKSVCLHLLAPGPHAPSPAFPGPRNPKAAA